MIPPYAGFAGHINWFTGHMERASKEIVKKLRLADIVIEVRDARLPYSSSNQRLEAYIGAQKRRLIVYNKSDLANPHLECAITNSIGLPAMFVSTNKGRGIGRIVRTSLKIKSNKIKGLSMTGPGGKKGTAEESGSGAAGGKVRASSSPLVVMVVGMPNAGKSSLINAMRKHHSRSLKSKVAKVEAKPGLTQRLSTFVVSHKPPVLIIDTPGVMLPSVSNVEHGLKLALAGAITDHRVGDEALAEYAVHLMNHTSPAAYCDFLGVPAPIVDDPEGLHAALATRFGVASHGARQFVRMFRDGKFGRFTFDNVDAGVRHGEAPHPV